MDFSHTIGNEGLPPGGGLTVYPLEGDHGVGVQMDLMSMYVQCTNNLLKQTDKQETTA